MQVINREAFLSQLELVQAGLSTREVLEQSSCFVFTGGRIITFNDEVACSIKTELDITGAIVATPLLNLLRKMEEEQLNIELVKGELLISGKRRKGGLTCQNEILLPFASVEPPKKWSKLPTQFAEACKLAKQVVSTDEAKFAFTCVHINADFVEGCDNIQMIRTSFPTGFKDSILIKGTAIASIVDLGISEFSLTESWAHFRNMAGLVISCRRYIESYPDLSKILEVQGKPIVLPKALVEATDKAAIFANDTADAGFVSISVRAGKLMIKGTGAFGWYKEIKSIVYKGPPFEFLIAPNLLTDIVKNYNDCIITPNRLMVHTANFKFVTCLRTPTVHKEKEGEADEGEE